MKRFKISKIVFVPFFLFVLFSVGSNCFAQSLNENPDSIKIRKVFFAIGPGYPEFISLRLGWQIDRKISITAKSGIYCNGAGSNSIFNSTLFWCLKGAYYFQNGFLNVNNVALNVGYSEGEFGKGNYVFEFSAGEEPISNEWFNVYWAATLNIVAPASRGVFITPGLTTGIIFNF